MSPFYRRRWLVWLFAILGCGALNCGGCATTSPVANLSSLTHSLGTATARGQRTDSANERFVAGLTVDQFTAAPLQRFKQVRLNAPVDVVFAYVADHEAMPDWIPMMHRVTVDNSRSQAGPATCGVGSERICDLGSDTIRETIAAWRPNEMFAYRVNEGQSGVPIDGGFGIMTFAPQDDHSTLMTWRIYYRPKPWNLKAMIMPVMINYQLNGGLQNLVKRFGGEIMSQ